MPVDCWLCRNVRLVLLSAVLGGGAGLVALALGGSRELSMPATFVGALLPILWRARKERIRGADRM